MLAALKTRAIEHKHTPTIGRSHGIHAEPTTFGLKLAGYYAEFARNRARLVAARAEVATWRRSAARSAPSPSVDPRVEAYVAAKLGLAVEPVSTQVVPRDRHAAFFCTLAVIAAGIERLATEVRHLQRTEVREAEEFFHAGPEGLLGDAAQAQPGAEREPDRPGAAGARRRGAGAGERGAVARARHQPFLGGAGHRARTPRIALDFALARLAGMMEKLLVYPERMRRTWRAWAAWCTRGEVLLALTQGGHPARGRLSRSCSATRWRPGPGWGRRRGDRSATTCKRIPDVARMVKPAELDAAMDPGLHLRAVDRIFERVFG